MHANKLYRQLEKDFIKPGMNDDWVKDMASISEYLSNNFRERSIGVVCDFTEDIHIVYTAVFPSDMVMKKILRDNVRNAMLFVHHPSKWDITKKPVFQQMDTRLLQQFKNKNISIYNLHSPLDNYGIYSTSVTLAKALHATPKKPFGPYNGGLCGTFAKIDISTLKELAKRFRDTLGHKISLYTYGHENIANEDIAFIGGGGNSIDLLEELVKYDVRTLVTGVTSVNSYSSAAHAFAKKHKINILGGTHYSTEKFACIAMVDYFKKRGLKSEFVSDKPCMKDL